MNNLYGWAAAQRPLPIFRTVRRAFELLWIHRILHVRLLLPVFLLLTAVITLANGKMAGVDPEKVADVLKDIPNIYWVPWMLCSMAGTIMLMMFSVSWRRFLILDETPSAVTFSKPFRRYLVMFVVAYFSTIFGGAILANILFGVLQTVGGKGADANAVTSAFCLVVAITAAVLTVARFALIFTAAVVGNETMKLRTAATLIQGNLLRFIAAWGIVALGTDASGNLLMWGLQGLGLNQAGLAGSLVIGVLTSTTMILVCSLTASVGALTYDFIVHGNGPNNASMS